jgi:hypothetical protein
MSDGPEDVFGISLEELRLERPRNMPTGIGYDTVRLITQSDYNAELVCLLEPSCLRVYGDYTPRMIGREAIELVASEPRLLDVRELSFFHGWSGLKILAVGGYSSPREMHESSCHYASILRDLFMRGRKTFGLKFGRIFPFFADTCSAIDRHDRMKISFKSLDVKSRTDERGRFIIDRSSSARFGEGIL